MTTKLENVIVNQVIRNLGTRTRKSDSRTQPQNLEHTLVTRDRAAGEERLLAYLEAEELNIWSASN